MSSVIQERIRLGVVDILYEAAAQRNWRLATDAGAGHRDVDKQGRGNPPRDAPDFPPSLHGSCIPCNRARSVSIT